MLDIKSIEHLQLADLGSTDYGADMQMQTCIPVRTWFTQLVFATIPQTGSLHR